MKNILVIGGSYFAGRVFVEKISEQKEFGVYVFNRGNLVLNIEGVTEIKGDRENPVHIAKRIPKMHFHAIVDFCGYTPEHITTLLDNFTGSTDHYIFISTTSIYQQPAPGTAPLPLKENAKKVNAIQPELGDFADYGYNKWRAECALTSICTFRSIPATILRPAIIYGKYNYAPRETYFFKAMISGTPLILPAHAPARFSFVWVEDLAEIINGFINTPVAGVGHYNVAAPETPDYAELLSLMEQACGHPVPCTRMTRQELAEHRIPLPYPPDEPLLYDGSSLAEKRDFAYTPLSHGMRRTWMYFVALTEHKKRMAATAAI